MARGGKRGGAAPAAGSLAFSLDAARRLLAVFFLRLLGAAGALSLARQAFGWDYRSVVGSLVDLTEAGAHAIIGLAALVWAVVRLALGDWAQAPLALSERESLAAIYVLALLIVPILWGRSRPKVLQTGEEAPPRVALLGTPVLVIFALMAAFIAVLGPGLHARFGLAVATVMTAYVLVGLWTAYRAPQVGARRFFLRRAPSGHWLTALSRIVWENIAIALVLLAMDQVLPSAP